MNELRHDLARIFAGLAAPDSFSEAANWHYNRKVAYVRDSATVAEAVRDTFYIFDKYGIDLAGKSVLDLGCGVGYTSIYFAAAGAERVVGLDASENKSKVFHLFVDRLPGELAERLVVETTRLDAVNFDSDFDVIFAQESISHIIDDDIFARLFKMLRPGGHLYISDHNNSLYGPYMKEIRTEWKRFELGPVGQGAHHSVDYAYRDKRAELISDWFPELDETTVAALADNTAYLHGEGLRQAVQTYIDGGKMPDSPYREGTPPVNPAGGYLMERTFSPFRLRRELLNIGFRECRVHSAEGIGRPWWVRGTLSLVPLQIKFRIRPGFKLLATK